MSNPPTGVPSGAGPSSGLPETNCSRPNNGVGLPFPYYHQGDFGLTQNLTVNTVVAGQPWSLSALAFEGAEHEHVVASLEMGAYGPYNTGIASVQVVSYQQNIYVGDTNPPGTNLIASINVETLVDSNAADANVGVQVRSGASTGSGTWSYSNNGPRGVLQTTPVLVAPNGRISVVVSALVTDLNANSSATAGTTSDLSYNYPCDSSKRFAGLRDHRRIR